MYDDRHKSTFITRYAHNLAGLFKNTGITLLLLLVFGAIVGAFYAPPALGHHFYGEAGMLGGFVFDGLLLFFGIPAFKAWING